MGEKEEKKVDHDNLMKEQYIDKHQKFYEKYASKIARYDHWQERLDTI